MPKIKIITSNFLNSKSQIGFESGHFKYTREKNSSTYQTLGIKQIKTLTYKKPDAHSAGHRHRGLISAAINLGSALKSMKTAKNIEFDVHFKDGKHLAGVTSLDEYFKIQNAWLDNK